MMWINRTVMTWSTVLLMLLAITLLTACSGGDHMLLAEFDDDEKAEIFLAELDAPESEWQSLAEDAEQTFIFPGELAAFVPQTNHIVLWYIYDDELRIEQMEIGDESPSELLEADAHATVFGFIEQDPLAVFLTVIEDFEEYRCYVSLDGAKPERLDRSSRCSANENGAVLMDFDDDGTTVTLVSLDGEEETVILDEVDDVGDNVRFNEELTMFAYVETDGDEAQMFLVEPGGEEEEEFGEEFAAINSFGFLADGETIYVIGRLDEDDEEVGLFVNAAGGALLEADDITLTGQSEDGDYAIFLTESGDEMAAFIYNLAEGTVTEIAEEPSVSLVGFLTEDRFLLRTENDDENALLSVSNDGSEVIELLETDDYDILYLPYMNEAAGQLLVLLTDEEGTNTLYVTSLVEEDGYFLLEEWYHTVILAASDEYLIFSGHEDEGDDVAALYAIPWSPDVSEIELDDDAESGYWGVFFAADGRSIYYTAVEDGPDDTEVRRVLVDGSERPEGLYRDMMLLDVSWAGEQNLRFLR